MAAQLRETPPEGEVSRSRAGFPTLKARTAGGSLYLHSSYDPWSEAAGLTEDFRLLAGDVMLVFGIGMGYHVWELARRHPRVEIIAIDPRPGFFVRAMETLDLAPYLSRTNLTLVFSHDVLEIGDLVTGRVDLTNRTQVKTYIYPPLARLYPEEFAEMQRGVFEGLVQSVIKRNTALFFAEQWTGNLLANLEATWRSQGIGVLRGAFAGMPAVVISAGPSLDKNMHLLKELEGRAVTLAAGTAFKPLAAAGLKPDMVVSVDGGEGNAENFRDVEEAQTALVFDTVIHPSIPGRFTGPRFAGCGYPYFHFFLDSVLGIDRGLFSVTGYSVALYCLGLALEMGCDPIIFIGQDLALTGGRSHVKGSIYDSYDENPPPEKLFEVDGNHGEKVLTNTVLLSFLRNLESELAAAGDGHTFINATEGGARIRGTAVMSLREAIDTRLGGDYGTRARLRDLFAGHDPAREYDRLLASLREIRRDLAELAALTGGGGRLGRRLAKLYAAGLPSPVSLARIKKAFARTDSRILAKWRANLLLERAAYPVHVATFCDHVDRHEELDAREQGAMIAAQTETFYEGLKETIQRTENMVRETISQLEKISS